VPASKTPAFVAAAGARASYRFLEFFTAQIRDPHTRRAHPMPSGEFFDWVEEKGVTQLEVIESVQCRDLHRAVEPSAIRADHEAMPRPARHVLDWMVIGDRSDVSRSNQNL
jgi:hypothetical protein